MSILPNAVVNELKPRKEPRPNATEPEHVITLGPLQVRILFTMWRHPQLVTVQEVCDHLNHEQGARKLAYTTYLTVMRNLTRRGFVNQARTAGRFHHFTPLITEEQYRQRLLQHVCDTAFGGSKNMLFAAVAAL